MIIFVIEEIIVVSGRIEYNYNFSL